MKDEVCHTKAAAAVMSARWQKWRLQLQHQSKMLSRTLKHGVEVESCSSIVESAGGEGEVSGVLGRRIPSTKPFLDACD
jgi:hypothetical protein